MGYAQGEHKDILLRDTIILNMSIRVREYDHEFVIGLQTVYTFLPGRCIRLAYIAQCEYWDPAQGHPKHAIGDVARSELTPGPIDGRIKEMLTNKQRIVALILRDKRPPVIEGTNVIYDDRLRAAWYAEVTEELDHHAITDIRAFL